jgi:4-hydroxybenzoate polyprenyltransferase
MTVVQTILKKLTLWGNLVAFSHSIFALPFAVIALVVVGRRYPVSWAQVVWLLSAVVAARTAAMAFNRLVDVAIDAANPRTRIRDLPRGALRQWEAWVIVGVSVLVFTAAAGMLGRHCVFFVPPVLVVLLGYSLLKRYTALCHLVLGVALALAPGGVWYALTATIAWDPVPLMAAVAAWVAGFDILYSCQDIDFDRAHGLFSIPGLLGVGGARMVSAALHLVAVVCLGVFGVWFRLGVVSGVGLVLFATLLVSQHMAVARCGIGCIDRVFFTRNGAASLVLMASVAIETAF